MYVQGGLMLVILLVSPNIPRADVVLLFLLALSSVFYFFAVNKSWAGVFEIQKERWLLASFFGLSLYLHLNALWATNPSDALLKAITFMLVSLIAMLMARTFRQQSDDAIARTGKVIVWGAVIGIGLACFEFAAGQPIKQAILTAWPSIRSGNNSIQVFIQENGKLIELMESEFRRHYDNVKIVLNPSAFNRNATLIMLLLWPVLLLATNQTNRFTRYATVPLIAGASALSVILSHSQTAQVALVLSGLAFLAAYFATRITHHVITAAWCIAILFAAPLAATPYELGLHKADWVFSSARDRIVLWGYTARQIPTAPILGVGIRSTRFMSKKLLKTTVKKPENAAYPLRLGRHSHNHYLQIWYELGAVGAVLYLLAGLALLQKIRCLAQSVRPYATAGFVAACSVAAFGWGLWQTWLLAIYSLSAILLIFAGEFAKRPAQYTKSADGQEA